MERFQSLPNIFGHVSQEKVFRYMKFGTNLFNNNYFLLSLKRSIFGSLNEDSALPQLNISSFPAFYCFFSQENNLAIVF